MEEVYEPSVGVCMYTERKRGETDATDREGEGGHETVDPAVGGEYFIHLPPSGSVRHAIIIIV